MGRRTVYAICEVPGLLTKAATSAAGPKKTAQDRSAAVQSEARVPRGQKGAGEWTKTGTAASSSSPAATPRKLTRSEDAAAERALRSGQAEIVPTAGKPGSYTLRVRPDGAARMRTVGTDYKSTAEAKSFVVPSLAVKSPAASPAKPAKASSSRKPAEPARAYKDVGEKIGGARKDIASARERFDESPSEENLKALEAQDPAAASRSVKKSAIWKLPDADKMRESGDTPEYVYTTHALYSLIAPKPEHDTEAGRHAYLAGVDMLRQMVGSSGGDTYSLLDKLAELDRDIRAVGEHIRWQQGKERSERYGFTNYAPEPACSEYQRIRGAMAASLGKRFLSAFLGNPPKVKGTEVAFRRWQQYGIPNFRGMYGRTGIRPEVAPTPEEVSRRWKIVAGAFGGGGGGSGSGGKSTGGENGGSDEKSLTPEMQAAREERERLRQWERTIPTAYERKGGKPITIRRPEDYLRHFGLRAVEFGNWMDDASARLHVERCAEAFADLADALGIPAKDLALNGRLALAFGARGHGAAAAHYEPHKVVINLTKMGGAGSLAHEWGHFLDHTLQRLEIGPADTMDLLSATASGSGSKKAAEASPIASAMRTLMRTVIYGTGSTTYRPDPKDPKILRGFPGAKRHPSWDHELEANGGDVAKALSSIRSRYRYADADLKTVANYYAAKHRKTKQIEIPTSLSDYYTRMSNLDQGRGKYYSQPEEMFARCFESYVEDALASKRGGGRYNNYLVHRSKSSPIAPMPQGKEREAIVRDMGALIDAVRAAGTLKKAVDLFDVLAVSGDEELARIHFPWMPRRISDAEEAAAV